MYCVAGPLLRHDISVGLNLCPSGRGRNGGIQPFLPKTTSPAGVFTIIITVPSGRRCNVKLFHNNIDICIITFGTSL